MVKRAKSRKTFGFVSFTLFHSRDVIFRDLIFLSVALFLTSLLSGYLEKLEKMISRRLTLAFQALSTPSNRNAAFMRSCNKISRLASLCLVRVRLLV